MAGNAVEPDEGRQCPLRGPREHRLSRLADEHVVAAEVLERNIRRLRADRVRLFPNDEEECEVARSRGTQPLPRRDHRRQDAFGVAGTAPVDVRLVLPGAEPGWDGVDMRVEHDARMTARGREDIEARLAYRVFAARVAEPRQLIEH